MPESSATQRAPRDAVLTLERLEATFRDALCGPRHGGSSEVTWTDGGADLILHVGKLQVRTVGSTLVVAIDTESAEFGIAALIVRFVFGGEGGPTSLVAATDATALGHPQVAARWGDLFGDVVWAAFARQIEVEGRGSTPAGIKVADRQLQVAFAEPISMVALARAQRRDPIGRGNRPSTGRLAEAGDPGAAR